MRKLTASILAIAALGGTTFTGTALAAAPGSHARLDRTSLDRSAGKLDRADPSARHESKRTDRSSSAHDR